MRAASALALPRRHIRRLLPAALIAVALRLALLRLRLHRRAVQGLVGLHIVLFAIAVSLDPDLDQHRDAQEFVGVIDAKPPGCVACLLYTSDAADE